jgi:hypothetical protein
MRIAIDGPLKSTDGYSVATRGVIAALSRLGADVVSDVNWKDRALWLEPEVEEAIKRGHSGADFGIRFSQPDSAECTPGRIKVCFSMWEFTSVPRGTHKKVNGELKRVKSWPEGMEQADAHFVPCEFSRRLWLDAGCTKPIFVVPLGYDERDYFIRQRSDDRPFTFISAGTLSSRKNPNLLLKCFREVFGDDPAYRLIFKTCEGLPLHWKDLPANVTVISESWSHSRIAGLYASADVFVNPTQGEGFGLPLVESMATGLPVIVTGWSAPVDFVNSEVGWFLDYEMREVGTEWHFEDGSYQKIGYAQPTEESLKNALDYAADHRDECWRKGMKAAAMVRNRYTWGHTARRIVEICEGWEVTDE